ncbi:MAG: restriction endonuclease subunit S [Thermoguttaceae bacterium]|nr:restriction endonuclease subunit S [Thermoguttaceae bacterium]
MEKMFPKEGSLVPEIRFRGFQGEWERASFGDVFSLLTNNTLSRADLNYEKGSVLNVHYGDILVKFREIVDIAIEQLPYITDTATTEKNIRSRLYNGDVIIADTAEDETVGKAVEVIGILNIPVVSGLHTIPCRPNLKFALKYFGFYLNSPSYRNQLFPLMQGIKVSSISKSALLNTNVLFPTDQQEQEKIGAFLDRLNSEITLLSKKLLKLQTLKQSLLQKMFV